MKCLLLLLNRRSYLGSGSLEELGATTEEEVGLLFALLREMLEQDVQQLQRGAEATPTASGASEGIGGNHADQS
jgi:hypothetical protein